MWGFEPYVSNAHFGECRHCQAIQVSSGDNVFTGVVAPASAHAQAVSASLPPLAGCIVGAPPHCALHAYLAALLAAADSLRPHRCPAMPGSQADPCLVCSASWPARAPHSSSSHRISGRGPFKATSDQPASCSRYAAPADLATSADPATPAAAAATAAAGAPSGCPAAATAAAASAAARWLATPSDGAH